MGQNPGLSFVSVGLKEACSLNGAFQMQRCQRKDPLTGVQGTEPRPGRGPSRTLRWDLGFIHTQSLAPGRAGGEDELNEDKQRVRSET